MICPKKKFSKRKTFSTLTNAENLLKWEWKEAHATFGSYYIPVITKMSLNTNMTQKVIYSHKMIRDIIIMVKNHD